jgi:drug/metabolite transporter (DMT)-like permease
MLGVTIALLTALAWAGSSTILKFLTAKIDTLSLNTLRLWVGSIILLSFVFLSGRGDALIHTELTPLLLVMASGVVAIAVGDTIYIKSLSFIDVSRAFPIGQCTFPVMTMVVAILFLQEPFTWLNGVGAVLVLLGVYLVAVLDKGARAAASAGANAKGVILALGAAVAWTIGAATLKLGVMNMDTFVAAAIRIPISAIALTILVLSRRREGGTLQFKKYGRHNVVLAAGAGILTYGVAAVGYVTAMQLIGAGKTVLITAIAPILLLPFSILVLKERLTVYGTFGILTCVAGVYLIVL